MFLVYVYEYKCLLTKLFYILLLGWCALRESNPRRSLRRQLLYPVKLRAQFAANLAQIDIKKKLLSKQ